MNLNSRHLILNSQKGDTAMYKTILVFSLVVLATLFCFVSCDDSTSSTKKILPVGEKATPLTLENSGDSVMIVSVTIEGYEADEINLKYSIDGGEKQDIPSSGAPLIMVGAGGTISFYGDRKEMTGSSRSYISITCSSDCYVYGNVMSLIKSEDFASSTSLENHPYAFYKLFLENSHLKNHKTKSLILPATKLADWCYCEMFSFCEGLTEAPELPATTLTDNCYFSMFFNCAGLTKAPALPARSLTASCYSWMFLNCSSLEKAPDLPATTLAANCYENMFSGCTKLAEAPELPAMDLVSNCYNGMFGDCTSLTKAPLLPATTLADYCYWGMFQGCSNLTAVTCLATQTADQATKKWLNGVASSGKFTKAADADFWTTDANGIPSGWTTNEE